MLREFLKILTLQVDKNVPKCICFVFINSIVGVALIEIDSRNLMVCKAPRNTYSHGCIEKVVQF